MSIDLLMTLITCYCVSISRSRSSQMSYKIGVLKTFATFTRKHTLVSLFFNKAAGLEPATFVKRDSRKSVLLRVLQNF